jgi:hypothetical protein
MVTNVTLVFKDATSTLVTMFTIVSLVTTVTAVAILTLITTVTGGLTFAMVTGTRKKCFDLQTCSNVS